MDFKRQSTMEGLGMNFNQLKKAYSGKKVFVTGHTGFKGSWLIEFLKKLDSEVIGYALEPSTTPNLFSITDISSVKSFFGDIRDANNLERAMNSSRPDFVIHMAAQPLVRESYVSPVKTYETNVIGTLNLLESCRKCDSVKAVLLVTTDKVYENMEWVYSYRENDTLGGHDPYSSSKACCELLASSYKRSYFDSSMNAPLVATSRAGNVIGGGDWSVDRLIPDIVRAASEGQSVLIRNRNSIRPWQHVLDCLHGYLMLGARLLNNEPSFASSWNFSPHFSDTKTVEEVAVFAKKIWNKVNIDFSLYEYNFHEAGLLKLDNSKAVNELNWIPLWTTEEAVMKTILWYKDFYINGKVDTKEQIQEFINILK